LDSASVAQSKDGKSKNHALYQNIRKIDKERSSARGGDL